MARSSRLSSRYTDQPTAATKIPSTSPASVPAILHHLVALASLSLSFRELFAPSEIHDYMETQFGGHFAFLTVLGLSFTWITFAVSLAKDFFPRVKAFDLLKTWLSILVIPAEGIISVLYWGMTAYDPTLLVPAESKFQIPFRLDIGIHALPAFFLWSDFLLFSPRMSTKANPAAVSAIAAVCYSSWMEYCASINGHFPYPFLNTMPKFSRAQFYVGVIPVMIGLFHVANGVHLLVRGKGKGAGPEAEVVKKVE
ncbi:hypothetical protein MNV49_003189 [Pseudohyphozyma bogoriensis]|nr:hypothetical protein MNV49_003189 [Pseudohyphozyma bogoriensis]